MKKKSKQALTFVIVAAVLILLGIFGGNLFSIFNPSQTGLIHLNVVPSESVPEGNANAGYGNQLGRTSGTVTGTQNGGGDSDVFQYSIEQSPVTIDTGQNIFRFEFEKAGNGVTLGLPQPNPPVSTLGLPYCWQKVNVYKNNQFLQTIKSWGNDADAWNTKDYFKSNTYRFYDNPNDPDSTYIELKMDDFNEGNYQAKFYGICRIFVNEFKIEFSDESFEINVSSPTQTFIQGSNVTVFVDINNNIGKPVNSNTKIILSTDTIFGEVLKTFDQNLQLNPGNNRIEFSFPATRPEDRIRAKVDVEVKYLGSYLQGLNEYRNVYTTTQCFNTNSQGGCTQSRVYSNSRLLTEIQSQELVNIGIAESETISLSVSPNPLYLEINNNACPQGYVPNSESTFCIRNDVSELSCFVLGCPTVSGTQYQCTSAGICAETVFVSQACLYDSESIALLNQSQISSIPSNQICPTGTSCDTGSGFCVNSQIYQSLVQCNVPSDCPTACEGKMATCNSLNKCAYSGECTVQSYGCMQLGCSEGYSCDSERNVCESNRNLLNNPLAYIISIVVIIIAILFFAIRRRK